MKYLFTFLLFFVSLNSYSWDGYDYESGTYIEIDKGNLVRAGEEIEIYDYGTDEYINVEVESITGNGSGAELEVYNYDTGEYRTLDMD